VARLHDRRRTLRAISSGSEPGPEEFSWPRQRAGELPPVGGLPTATGASPPASGASPLRS